MSYATCQEAFALYTIDFIKELQKMLSNAAALHGATGPNEPIYEPTPITSPGCSDAA